MNTGMPTDEVTDAIAYIEMHRQEMAREAGVPAACAQALQQLQELLEQERQALQTSNGSGDSANVEAVTNQINRVKSLASGNGQSRNSNRPHSGRPGQQQTSRRNRSRNKGRGTGGRPGGR